ncbi:MAG TPA: hypothetical protein VMM78_07745 [Thermomicrobiales bacterium]|nr:hypothetical protein [Thermomicrobiales bacterium]
MSSASLSLIKPDVTVEDLERLGFTDSEIFTLTALRAAYPFIEYVDTASQWRRLLFLQWRYRHGDLQRI